MTLETSVEEVHHSPFGVATLCRKQTTAPSAEVRCAFIVDGNRWYDENAEHIVNDTYQRPFFRRW